MTKEDILHHFQDINFYYGDCMMYADLSGMLDELIAENKEEPKTGHWIDDHADTVCSECGWSCNEAYFWNDEKRTYGYYSKFCPNCGAKMKGGEE